MVSAQTAGNDQSYVEENEAGTQDNLLSLNPNDPKWKETVGAWEDGKEYKGVTVDLRQISPGEFEVTSLEAPADTGVEEETPAEDASSGPEEGAGEEAAAPEMPMSKNPAMDNYLKRKYKGA